MSTNATYDILGTVFYCHHDGYKEGGANYLFNMVKASNVLRIRDTPGEPLNTYENRGGWPFAFIRGNGQAEPTTGDRSDINTDFRYTVTLTDNGLLWLNAEAWNHSVSGWAPLYNGELSAFVNLYPEFHEGEIVSAKLPRYPNKVDTIYATAKQAEIIAHETQRYADHFKEGNPNIAGCTKRADAWLVALGQKTEIAA